MIHLKNYLDYWKEIAVSIREITGVLPVTIDDQMGKRIQALPAASTTLFVLPPLVEADKAAAFDGYCEENKCVIFIMSKYDPQRRDAFDVLAELQPVADRIKKEMFAREGAGAPFMLDVASIETAPETELYGRFAGWSITFDARSS